MPQRKLMDEVLAGNPDDDDTRYTARVLSQAWRGEIREEAVTWLREHRQGEAIDLDAVLAMEGDAAHGQAVFTEYCAACHQVGDRGVRFGPNLDKIGAKLGPDALVAAIAYPSQGIGFGYEGYEGYEMTRADGSRHTGYIESQTENELTLRTMGGLARTLVKNDIAERRALDESLMTAGLHEIMATEELADLVAYLSSLGTKDQETLSKK